MASCEVQTPLPVLDNNNVSSSSSSSSSSASVINNNNNEKKKKKTNRAPPTLRSNEGNPIDVASTGWMHSVTTDTPIEEMRARYELDGYLWVKHLLPREDVLDMREQ